MRRLTEGTGYARMSHYLSMKFCHNCVHGGNKIVSDGEVAKYVFVCKAGKSFPVWGCVRFHGKYRKKRL